MRLAPHDTWPDLRITIHLLPWSWRWRRPRFYRDHVEGALGHCSIRFGPFRVEWYGEPGGWRAQFWLVEKDLR